MIPAEWAWPVWVRADQSFIFVMKDRDRLPLPLAGLTFGLKIESEAGALEMLSSTSSGLTILDDGSLDLRGQIEVVFTLDQQKSFLTRTPPRYEFFRDDAGRRYPCFYGEIQAQNAVSPT